MIVWIVSLYLVGCYLIAVAVHKQPAYIEKMQERVDAGRGLAYFAIQGFVLLVSIPVLVVLAIIRAKKNPKRD